MSYNVQFTYKSLMWTCRPLGPTQYTTLTNGSIHLTFLCLSTLLHYTVTYLSLSCVWGLVYNHSSGNVSITCRSLSFNCIRLCEAINLMYVAIQDENLNSYISCTGHAMLSSRAAGCHITDCTYLQIC